MGQNDFVLGSSVMFERYVMLKYDLYLLCSNGGICFSSFLRTKNAAMGYLFMAGELR